MKTTIIELLNKMANGEVPKKILYDDMIWRFDDGDNYYWSDGRLLDDYCDITKILNDEVEILETTITYSQDNIENNKQDKIEKIDITDKSICVKGTRFFRDKDIEIFQKLSMVINEIIDRIN